MAERDTELGENSISANCELPNPRPSGKGVLAGAIIVRDDGCGTSNTELSHGCGMALTFEWDEVKDGLNRHKHGLGFDEAKTIFNDPRSLTIHDVEHSDEENRFIDVGLSDRGRVLVVSYTERGTNIRIISCRKATKSERNIYGQNAQEN